jgi:rhodanese-related sulfurtransferase
MAIVLIILFSSSACQANEAMAWEKLNAEIQRRFPHSRSLTIEDLRQKLASGEPLILIDARAREEYQVSHLKNAIHLTDPKTVLASYGDGRQPVIVYCSVGYRSAKMVDQLARAGMKNVFNLKGSIFEWANSGYPVYNQAGITPFVHPFDEKWGVLLNKNLHRYQP